VVEVELEKYLSKRNDGPPKKLEYPNDFVNVKRFQKKKSPSIKRKTLSARKEGKRVDNPK
jgi:hypothetical protein